MLIEIDRDSDTPIYQQVIDRLKEMIEQGTLEGGEELPGSRKLAEDLGVSRKTTLTAYQELRAQNYIDTVPGGKTYVLDRDRELPTHEPFEYNAPEAEEELREMGLFDWEPYQVPTEFFGLPRSLKRAQEGAPEGMIEMHRNMPDPSLFPFDKIKRIASDLLWDPQEFFFDYGSAQGYQPLVTWLEEHMAKQGVDMEPGVNEIIVGSGFKGLFKVVLDLLVRGDELVVTENPTYSNVINTLMANRVRHTGVPVDEHGMRVDRLEELLEERGEEVGIIYTVPTFHNPTGTVMSRERRARLIELSKQYRIPVVEDNWAYQLRYEGEKLPSLKAMDDGGFVIQINTFSKMLLPGLRLGWMVVPGPAALTGVRVKQVNAGSDSNFLQVLLHQFIEKGHLDKHLRRTERVYGNRRTELIDTLREKLPDVVELYPCRGGFFCWLELPEGLRSEVLYKICLENGVKFAPELMFSVNKEPGRGLRICFSQLGEGEIISGAERLAESVESYLDNPGDYTDLETDYYGLKY